MAGGTHRAVFMDRDGTVNREVGHVDRLEKFELLSGTAEAIQRLNARGFKAVVVTNQSGVARGYFTEDFIQGLHRQLEAHLARHGARLDGIYYCPHSPEADCGCRKPVPGMLLKAAAELDIDLGRSYVVGDKQVDVELAHRVGASGILVLTGYAGQEPGRDPAHPPVRPDYVARDLLDAVDWVLAHGQATEETGTRR